MPGIFIAFDGIDGSGKTTQVNLLAQSLANAGLGVVVSKEPTDGIWGKKIRETAFTTRLNLEDELNAFIKDREEHIRELITPSLKEGKVVILDRYFYSTIAYQGARGADRDYLKSICQKSSITPDVSFIMDVPSSTSEQRILLRDGKANNFEGSEYLANVKKFYDWQCDVDPSLVKINGTLSIDQIHHDIVSFLVNGELRKKKCFKDYGCDNETSCAYANRGLCEWATIRKKTFDHLTQNNRPSIINEN